MRPAMEQVPLDRVRTTGEVLNDTLDFLRQHGRILLPIVLRVILPMFIVGQILWGLFSTRVASLVQQMSDPWMIDNSSFTTGSESLDTLLILSAALLLFLAFSFGVAACYSFLRTLEGRDVRVDGMPTVEDFQQEYRNLKNIVLGTHLGLVVLWIAAILLMSLLFGLLSTFGILPGVFAIVAATAFLAPYIMIRFSLYYPARLIEEGTLMGAFGRSSELVSGAWWRTFGLLVAAVLLTWVFSFSGLFPVLLIQYLVMLGVVPVFSETSTMGIALSVVGGVLSGVVSTLGMVTYLFIGVYFCSRREEKEGGSLLVEIESIGGGE